MYSSFVGDSDDKLHDDDDDVDNFASGWAKYSREDYDDWG